MSLFKAFRRPTAIRRDGTSYTLGVQKWEKPGKTKTFFQDILRTIKSINCFLVTSHPSLDFLYFRLPQRRSCANSLEFAMRKCQPRWGISNGDSKEGAPWPPKILKIEHLEKDEDQHKELRSQTSSNILPADYQIPVLLPLCTLLWQCSLL